MTDVLELKSRSKRLGNAIKAMFGIKASRSQLLELLAKEEGFPNWDTLSGTVDKSINRTQQHAHNKALMISLGALKGRSNYLSKHLPYLIELIKPSAHVQGALILFSASMAQGKSTTLNTVINTLANENLDVDFGLLHIGPAEYAYSKNINVKYCQNIKDADIPSPFTQNNSNNYIVFEDQDDANMAAFYAHIGYKVLYSKHANSTEAALESFGKDLRDTTLKEFNSLCNRDAVVVIHQSLE